MQRYGFNFILNNPGSSQTSGGVLGPGQVSSGMVSGGVLTSTLAHAFGIVVSAASSHITALLRMLAGNDLPHTSPDPLLPAALRQTEPSLQGGTFSVPGRPA